MILTLWGQITRFRCIQPMIIKHQSLDRIFFTDHDGGVKNEIGPLYDP